MKQYRIPAWALRLKVGDRIWDPKTGLDFPSVESCAAYIRAYEGDHPQNNRDVRILICNPGNEPEIDHRGVITDILSVYA
jgi:hypothetical protein